MDKRTRSFIAKGAAVLGLAAAGAAAYRNDEKLFALGIRRSFGKHDAKRDAGLKAPDDVRLATFANKGLGPDYVRPLSRMEMDSKKAGETVADAIMHFLATGDFPDGIDVGPEWIAGDTL